MTTFRRSIASVAVAGVASLAWSAISAAPAPNVLYPGPGDRVQVW